MIAYWRTFSCNEPNILFCTLYVVFINESENKMKALIFVLVYCDKLTLLSLICDTLEMNIQRQTRLYLASYIKLHIYRSIYSGLLDLDISGFYCIYIYI